jgi:hypothetical protein
MENSASKIIDSLGGTVVAARFLLTEMAIAPSSRQAVSGGK